MRHSKFNFLFVIGLVLIFGLTSAFSMESGGDKNKTKRPKNMGVLSVRTTPGAYQVKVDGQVVGMSGVSTGAEFYLEPGMHHVEVEGPNGQTFTRDIEIRREQKNCVCLKVVENSTSRPCPYDIIVSGPDRVVEGDLITFASSNKVTTGAIPVIYNWTVTPGNLNITSGVGTPSITVDTTGFGGQTVTADLDVNDGVYDARCRQRISVPTTVERIPPPPVPKYSRCDIFESQSFDDDKARFDNCTIQLQATPDSQIYIILYQGTDKFSRVNTADKLGKRTLDYLVKTRGIDPRRVQIVKWGTRPRTSYEIYIIPPGAQPPVPN